MILRQAEVGKDLGPLRKMRQVSVCTTGCRGIAATERACRGDIARAHAARDDQSREGVTGN